MPVDRGEGFVAGESAGSGVVGCDRRASAARFVLVSREVEARSVDPFVSVIGVLVRPVDPFVVDVSDFSLLGAGAVMTFIKCS